VTIVAWQREGLFGEVMNGEMVLNECGKIVHVEWERTPEIRREMEFGAFVVMPNHFHAIVIFNENAVGAHGRAPLRGIAYRLPRSLGSLIAGFKSSVTKQINVLRNTPGVPVWQRNYYEHIIRSDRDLKNKTEYIEANPMLWDEDDENPINANS